MFLLLSWKLCLVCSRLFIDRRGWKRCSVARLVDGRFVFVEVPTFLGVHAHRVVGMSCLQSGSLLKLLWYDWTQGQREVARAHAAQSRMMT